MGQQRMREFDFEKGALVERDAKEKKAKHKGSDAAAKVVVKEPGKEIRYIVRIASKDLNGALPVRRALTAIKGIDTRMAEAMANAFVAASNFSPERLLGEVNEEQEKMLGEIVANPGKFGIPAWMFNRQKNFETGMQGHLVMADLDFAQRKDLTRMKELKSYKGLRHSWGLTVRGQRTRSTHRGKGGVVGVLKKEARMVQAAARRGGAEQKGKAEKSGKKEGEKQ